ncbi:conserved exported hypothetical protein [uncultured Gammaproteobacteria bacterium]
MKTIRALAMALALVLAGAAPGQAGDLVKETGRACVFGGVGLGVVSALVLYPAVATGTTSLPVTGLILGNSVFGCGIAAIGAAAAHGFAWLYDQMFTDSPAPGQSGARQIPSSFSPKDSQI